MIEKKRTNILRLPMKAPITTLKILTFLLSTIAVVKSKRKSNAKLINNTPSIYTVILVTIIIIDSMAKIFCQFTQKKKVINITFYSQFGDLDIGILMHAPQLAYHYHGVHLKIAYNRFDLCLFSK